MNLNEALKQFEAVQANLAKLDRLWEQIKPLLPSQPADGMTQTELYSQYKRAFEHIAKAMPQIDGFELQICLMDVDEIFGGLMDCLELGELSGSMSFISSIHYQGEVLSEYRFRLESKRRNLARNAISTLAGEAQELLPSLKRFAARLSHGSKLPDANLSQLKQKMDAIDVLLGNTFLRPPCWWDMARHLRFGLKGDLEDIIHKDWPEIRKWLDGQLYVESEPVPVEVKDLGEIVESNPKGVIATELNWGVLLPEGFERLIFNLLAKTSGYQNPKWQTQLNAPDRGRDIEVERVHHDSLVGPRTERVFIACKHTRSVGSTMIGQLREQTKLWTPPQVDELIVATTGRFSTDAIQYTEKLNASGSLPRVGLWANSDLERMLCFRPELVGEFRLRK